MNDGAQTKSSNSIESHKVAPNLINEGERSAALRFNQRTGRCSIVTI
jgi:hypothetical protein